MIPASGFFPAARKASLRYEVVGSKSNTRFMTPVNGCGTLKPLQLLRRGFGAAVPRLRKMRDGRAEAEVVERQGGIAERLVGHRPDSREYLAAQMPRLLGARDVRFNLLLQISRTGVP